MKRYLLLAVVFCCVLEGICAKEKVFAFTPMAEFKPNPVNRTRGYQVMEDGTITFVFDALIYEIPAQKIKKVYISGSFNNWTKTEAKWEMEARNSTSWILVCEKSDILLPGASGFPEFKFFVVHDTDYIKTICGKNFPATREDRIVYDAASKKPGYTYQKANLILFNNDNLQEIKRNEKAARVIKKRSSFKDRGLDGFAIFANFRKLPTLPIYRGYHPYKRTATLDTADKVMSAATSNEKQRIETTNALIERSGIQSIITLSGNEQLVQKKEKILPFVENINRQGNHMFTDLTDMQVYKIPATSQVFGDIMHEIITFMFEHPEPFYIHCHTGVDATGVICAYLEALCGVCWEDIKADYEQSNEAMMGAYRSWRLLAYSFEKVLGVPPDKCENLQSSITEYFIQKGYLNEAEIAQLNMLVQ